MYSEFCQCTIAEVDKYINYKSQGKMLRKKFKSYKPFWNSELTGLWKDMCHKERSARCLRSNLQHKKIIKNEIFNCKKNIDIKSTAKLILFFKCMHIFIYILLI